MFLNLVTHCIIPMLLLVLLNLAVYNEVQLKLNQNY